MQSRSPIPYILQSLPAARAWLFEKKIVPKPIIEQVEEEYETSEISFKFEKCALTDTSVGMFRNYQFKRKSKTLISKLTAVWWNESSLENPLKKRGTIKQVNCVEVL